MHLVYSQSRTLYGLIPQAPHPNSDPSKPPVETTIDGVVGSIYPSLVAKTSKQPNASATTPSTPTVFTEVNAIQSTQTPDNKKKGKVKIKNLETNRRIPRLQPRRMIKGRERISTLDFYVGVITSQRSSLVVKRLVNS